jgi:predicted nuclease with TOPRIM domain
MREVCDAEWDDIQDQLKEKGAEIERLKDKIRGLEKLNQMTDEEVVMELKTEIERLKGQSRELADLLSGTVAEWRPLLLRAADALESPAWEWHKSWALAKELRKAAQ